MRLSSFLGALSSLTQVALGASTFSPLRPPAIPLAVASPYLNTWLQGDNLPGTWPTFWTGSITGWQGFVSVDGAVYNWMGGHPGPAPVTQTAFEYTSTRSIFTFNVADKIKLTATFLTPVHPDDLVLKSLQSSYVEVTAVSLDGASHNVNLYMDISGEWANGDQGTQIVWDTGSSNGIHYHSIRTASEVVFQERSDQASWGTAFLATAEGDGLTYQLGEDTVVRSQFINNQVLTNAVDTTYRAINDRWPVVAYAHNYGSIGTASVSKLFGIGLSQVPVINFQGAGSSPVTLNAPWSSRWSDGITAMADWVKDYTTQAEFASTIDSKVINDAKTAGGDDYAAMTSLAVRQAFAALQPAQGTDKTYIFLKEISSNGDCSTVDVIFPAFPILTYFNVTLVKLLLEPLYENQESGHYPNKYAIHDLGTFPNALGYPAGNDEDMPVEECGNMIIMTLAYATKTGDNAYLSQHYPKLQQWAEYLIEDSLIPANQLSTDDFAGRLANQTNLALKGMIGLGAMGKIAQLTNNDDQYTATAQSYISQWYDLGINQNVSPQHTTLSYNNNDTWGLLYNLYADKLLKLGLVKDSVYDQQSQFYTTVMGTYGVPLDTRHTYTKIDWEAWVAAIVSPSTRASFYSKMVSYLTSTTNRAPMSDWYETTDASSPGFRARPVVGGLFAQLAL